MSQFQSIQASLIPIGAEPLDKSGSTCECYCIDVDGKRQFLKKLRKELSDDPRYVALFTKEFSVGSMLNHPNLVRYNTMDVLPSHESYMLLDYVSGETVSERLRNDPSYFQDIRTLQRFAMQLLDCLSYLHERQIVHLDIKTENLMLTQVDNSLMVLDLGFCYTDSYNALIGKTEGFAAPEQLSGNTDAIDERTDLFAVGRVLEEIESKAFREQGRTMPRRFTSLMRMCLMPDKKGRPANARECMKMLTVHRKRNWFVASALLASIVVLVISGNESVRQSLSYIIDNYHMRGYDVRDMDNTVYRILSREDRTCEVVGYRYDPHDLPDVYIKSEVEYYGKKYRTVSIKDSAFDSLLIITSVFIPDGIERIGAMAFKWDSEITSINVPNSVKSIGHSCFSDITQLRHIKLPDQLRELEFNMFTCDENLESIVLPSGIERIGKDCFVSCTSLVDVVMPDSLKVLERGVFYNCTALEEIVIPEGCREIGEYVFFECGNLRRVYNYSPVPQEITTIFNTPDVVVYVPKESLDAYRSHPAWKNMNIEPMG